MQLSKEENRELCERYPFLIPRNRWSGKRITECQEGGFWPGNPEAIPKYDYEYTELDEMPDGWRIAFGEQLCEELKEELIKAGQNAMDKYMITQIKEKFGYLHFYDNGCTERWYKEIMPKYVLLSRKTCICCGEPATRISTGWISPWCDKCANGLFDDTIPIEEWFAEIEED